MDHLGSEGEKNLRGVEAGCSVGEISPSSKCADGAWSWDVSGCDRLGSMTTDPCTRDEAICGENLGKPNTERSRPDQTEHCTRRQPLGT